MSDFMQKFAEWRRLAEIADRVPKPRPDNNPEMLADIAAQEALIAVPVDDLASLRAKASLPALNHNGPCPEHWDVLRADIERLAAAAVG